MSQQLDVFDYLAAKGPPKPRRARRKATDVFRDARDALAPKGVRFDAAAELDELDRNDGRTPAIDVARAALLGLLAGRPAPARPARPPKVFTPSVPTPSPLTLAQIAAWEDDVARRDTLPPGERPGFEMRRVERLGFDSVAYVQARNAWRAELLGVLGARVEQVRRLDVAVDDVDEEVEFFIHVRRHMLEPAWLDENPSWRERVATAKAELAKLRPFPPGGNLAGWAPAIEAGVLAPSPEKLAEWATSDAVRARRAGGGS